MPAIIIFLSARSQHKHRNTHIEIKVIEWVLGEKNIMLVLSSNQNREQISRPRTEIIFKVALICLFHRNHRLKWDLVSSRCFSKVQDDPTIEDCVYTWMLLQVSHLWRNILSPNLVHIECGWVSELTSAGASFGGGGGGGWGGGGGAVAPPRKKKKRKKWRKETKNNVKLLPSPPPPPKKKRKKEGRKLRITSNY